ncbi:hypothetical protein DFA_02358 [Cavenderia fasciculata]|uniref:Transmembrane protein n=1 Tax=Cavenderia fasciculata TaxID=261658 RepID=F4PZ83_CACFS|nr:uncharacterized protein DFA_02358 [Cavenderia fasciculata]EGG19112.1 hypothetical protein DFA_02358 [Cavenderia fasciculata]|eukprot:XP_004366745.1 hypothetical protein DFA_02358 [Cavenderia fasciculata]
MTSLNNSINDIDHHDGATPKTQPIKYEKPAAHPIQVAHQGPYIQPPPPPMMDQQFDNNFLYQQFKLLEASKIVRTEQKSKIDKKNAILMFCFGWIFFPLWVGGFAFLRSPSKVARDLGISALVFFACISIAVIIGVFVNFDHFISGNNLNGLSYT